MGSAELEPRAGGGLPASLTEERRLDVEGRIKACDIEGLPSLAGISSRNALSLLTKSKEEDSRIRERRVLKTGDARRLKRELLEIFAAEASSKLAKNSLLLLTPSLDVKVIRNRLKLSVNGREISDSLNALGKFVEFKRILSRLSFSPSQKTGSDTLEFFAARRDILGAVLEVLTRFSDAPSVASFFANADHETLRGILATVEEVEGASGIEDAEAVISDAELEINDALRKGVRDKERAVSIVEDKLAEIVSSLEMKWEEEELLKAAFETSALPIEFDRITVRKLVGEWRRRKEEELRARVEKAERRLRQHMSMVNDLVERAIILDEILAVASATKNYSLTIPEVGTGGIGFVSGRNPFLIRDELGGGTPGLQPVSYSIGKPSSIRLAKPRNAVVLTGANSGGKTTLLNTMAAIHILALLGLPVPAEKAETAPMPIYLFRKRVARKVGSLEQVLRSLIPVLADRRRKLVLIDELEALTEPGAAGRIIASIINKAATTTSLFLLVTHLAKETLPHVKLPVRVDGIEASGLDEKGDLVVDRQPRFDHIGSSTPKLIIMRLSRAAKKKAVKEIYDDVLASLAGGAGETIQAPLTFPWLEKETSPRRRLTR